MLTSLGTEAILFLKSESYFVKRHRDSKALYIRNAAASAILQGCFSNGYIGWGLSIHNQVGETIFSACKRESISVEPIMAANCY
ncbi:unnamed protein product [Trifolium pratense]|uniref:Uncharacterized protein n=1 Tax=Trifolium pratense TaxID=57577 RepID=A0ACB0IMC0_TRIPR|nr:unnamed protein product [Trifolium pratense]